MSNVTIAYHLNAAIDVDTFIDLLVASTLAQRRPVGDRQRIEAMLTCSNMTVTAWEGSTLVGIARSVSDYSFATYLSDLAVRTTHQRQGIGRELIRCTQAAAPLATVVLLSAPGVEPFYADAGMQPHAGAFVLRADDQVRARRDS